MNTTPHHAGAILTDLYLDIAMCGKQALGVVFHPNVWCDLQRMDLSYIYDPPDPSRPLTIYGLPVVLDPFRSEDSTFTFKVITDPDEWAIEQEYGE